ncbi:MAG: PIN domain-containing protein [Gemmataceae bacterium]|nr:PIN domain-containing protein [Gemmataceae bacterium]
MILLDTDSLTFALAGHPRVTERVRAAADEVALTIITRIEALTGRFAFVLKAADGDQLQRAQHRLDQAEVDLSKFPVIPIDAAGAAEFDRLRQIKKLKKIGRADLLIASIALAHGATLVTRNLKDFQLVPGLKLENWAD